MTARWRTMVATTNMTTVMKSMVRYAEPLWGALDRRTHTVKTNTTVYAPRQPSATMGVHVSNSVERTVQQRLNEYRYQLRLEGQK